MASTAQVNSLLSVAAELEPKEFVASFPSSMGLLGKSIIIDLPCFHRTTSIMLDHVFIRSVPVGVEFPMLEMLSLLHCNGNLDALLSCCPRLCTLLLSGILFETCDLRVNSPSLQDLVVRPFSTERVNIIAPMLKKLEILFTVMLDVNISVFAPIMEKAGGTATT
uniref:F-box/LRR-repeat protein 15/At3g58940/PEG3-like LRR domain-containing protein n=1 Tax=Aegilops tauschii TaxID=37682 RepID=M8BPE6_AEGTA